jgi:hypothetical protein
LIKLDTEYIFIEEPTNASNSFLLFTHSILCSYMFRQFIAIISELLYNL